jgi:hypothetical protein
MDRICVLVERFGEPVELFEDPIARLSLAAVGGIVGGHSGPDGRHRVQNEVTGAPCDVG